MSTTMACGHPLAARQISARAIGPRATDRRLTTTCWACAVETEIRNQPPKPIQAPTGRAHW